MRSFQMSKVCSKCAHCHEPARCLYGNEILIDDEAFCDFKLTWVNLKAEDLPCFVMKPSAPWMEIEGGDKKKVEHQSIFAKPSSADDDDEEAEEECHTRTVNAELKSFLAWRKVEEEKYANLKSSEVKKCGSCRHWKPEGACGWNGAAPECWKACGSPGEEDGKSCACWSSKIPPPLTADEFTRKPWLSQQSEISLAQAGVTKEDLEAFRDSSPLTAEEQKVLDAAPSAKEVAKMIMEKMPMSKCARCVRHDSGAWKVSCEANGATPEERSRNCRDYEPKVKCCGECALCSAMGGGRLYCWPHDRDVKADGPCCGKFLVNRR
jgi:hypothetical protein